MISVQRYWSRKPGDGCVYIYWSALHGNFMITLTNEQLDDRNYSHNSNILTCYIAPNDSYVELYSYISTFPPSLHDVVIQRRSFKISTMSFHRGCNTDDFIGYCLRMNRDTSDVSLMHTGSNGIYNHSELSCKFQKSELNLKTLQYINISTGSNSVTFKNLTVKYKVVPALHVSFDKTFNTTTHNKDVKLSVAVSNDGIRQHYLRSSSPTSKTLVQNFVDVVSRSAQNVIDVFGTRYGPLPACRDSFNCSLHHATDADSHNSKFSHPCRYADACRDIRNSQHLVQFTHEKRDVQNRKYGESCYNIADPIHRREFRHSGLPDFLIPCWFKNHCSNNSKEHRKNYSHGEFVTSTHVPSKPNRIAWRYGEQCKEMNNPKYLSDFHHDKPISSSKQPISTLKSNQFIINNSSHKFQNNDHNNTSENSFVVNDNLSSFRTYNQNETGRPSTNPSSASNTRHSFGNNDESETG
ncbi:unnamed protein product [Didymodactylos carnosus]|uniref:Uncharacterized protein n=1 Tax=Didymodactylos carnosus TaxID=1234261 RepID=A0A815R4J3_9BILA|nr:unnamed protein product [Didymodactylos carnosus]CAF4338331.1 unnamed protein product [Didymodactylos carnosus]